MKHIVLTTVLALAVGACASIPQYSNTINFTDTPSTAANYDRIREGALRVGCEPKQHAEDHSTFHCGGDLIVFRESRLEDGTRTGKVSVYCQNHSDAACSDIANRIMTSGGVESR